MLKNAYIHIMNAQTAPPDKKAIIQAAFRKRKMLRQNST